MPLAVCVNDRLRYAWFWLNACVTEPVAISATEAIDAASGVLTVKLPPYDSAEGEPVIAGRAPLNRYGGEKISAVRWSATPLSDPPPETGTRASGRSSAVE